MKIHELAGKPVPRSMLANIPRLIAAYYTRNIIGEQDERTGQDALLQLVDEIEDSLLRTDMGTYCFRRISGEAGIRETLYTDQTVRTGMFMAMMDLVYVGAF